MNGMRRRVTARAGVALCLGLLLGLGCATRGPVITTPEETVRRFCQLDFEGARLSSDTDRAMKSLVAWTQEPAPDPVCLVKGYEVGTPKVSGDRAEVPVRYEIIDWIGAPWKDDTRNTGLETGDTVTFRVERQDGVWKIVGPGVTPHASPQALAEVIRSWPQTGFGGNTDSRLQDTLKHLDSAGK